MEELKRALLYDVKAFSICMQGKYEIPVMELKRRHQSEGSSTFYFLFLVLGFFLSFIPAFVLLFDDTSTMLSDTYGIVWTRTLDDVWHMYASKKLRLIFTTVWLLLRLFAKATDSGKLWSRKVSIWKASICVMCKSNTTKLQCLDHVFYITF